MVLTPLLLGLLLLPALWSGGECGLQGLSGSCCPFQRAFEGYGGSLAGAWGARLSETGGHRELPSEVLGGGPRARWGALGAPKFELVRNAAQVWRGMPQELYPQHCLVALAALWRDFCESQTEDSEVIPRREPISSCKELGVAVRAWRCTEARCPARERLVLASPPGSDELCAGPPLQRHPVSVRSLQKVEGGGGRYGPFTVPVERKSVLFG